MAKAAKPKREPKTDNPEAVRKMAEARRADIAVKRPQFSSKRSPELEQAFLDGLRDCRSISRSAWAVGITEQTAYAWRNKSLATAEDDGNGGVRYRDDFCVRWQEAQQAGVDKLEDEAVRRAARGYEKPVYQGGVLVGSVTEYSDVLLGLVLRGKNPAVYNTERHEHTGKDGGAINMKLSVEFEKSEQKK